MLCVVGATSVPFNECVSACVCVVCVHSQNFCRCLRHSTRNVCVCVCVRDAAHLLCFTIKLLVCLSIARGLSACRRHFLCAVLRFVVYTAQSARRNNRKYITVSLANNERAIG